MFFYCANMNDNVFKLETIKPLIKLRPCVLVVPTSSNFFTQDDNVAFNLSL